ncbi:SDH family Clp fold serine proteinase [Variovorax sp. GB1R11]|uniref:SDH family Clp fold serine proteinase n=1 Tax=Variovorax sp. GB1R11 TaxID=3443741 RepID=UPI003F478ABB
MDENENPETSFVADASTSVKPPPEAIAVARPSVRKTPMYQAMQAPRYQRQSIIKKIMHLREREVVCYVGGDSSQISRKDVMFLSDLLYNVPRGSSVDLLLHTKGGDMDAAEKLSSMVREVVGTSDLTVVIPDYAKSSGTLIALGADQLMMSDSSELGPIDPQIVVEDPEGKRMASSLISYLDAYDSHAKRLRQDPSDAVARLMLEKFDPTKLHQLQMARERVLRIAEKQLQEGMFRKPPLGNFTGIPRKLIDVAHYASHGQMIGYRECKGLGLRVDYRAPGDELWDLFWQLYCFQRLEISDNSRKILFESSYACLASE